MPFYVIRSWDRLKWRAFPQLSSNIPVITVTVANLVHYCQIEVTCGCSCEAELLFAGIQCIV